MRHKKSFLFCAFVFASVADFFLTTNGIRKGFLVEANPAPLFLVAVTGFDIVKVFIILKIIGTIVFWWLVFRAYDFHISKYPEKKILWLGSESARSLFFWGPAVITSIMFLLGVIPGIFYHIIYYF